MIKYPLFRRNSRSPRRAITSLILAAGLFGLMTAGAEERAPGGTPATGNPNPAAVEVRNEGATAAKGLTAKAELCGKGGGYVSFALPADADPAQGTIGLWMQFPDADAAENPATVLIDLGGPSGSANRISLAALKHKWADEKPWGALRLQLVAGPQAPADQRVNTGYTAFDWKPGAWHHVALAWEDLDGSGHGLVRVFLDGAEIQRKTGVGLDLREGARICSVGRPIKRDSDSPVVVDDMAYWRQAIFPGPTIAERVMKLRGLNSVPPESWVGNRLGFSDEAPAPWTPVVAGERGFSVWNREYEMASPHPLFTQIISGGHKLLAAPITLDVVADGKEAQWEPPVIPVGTPVPAKAAAMVSGKAGDVGIAVKTTMEFDGMARVDVVLDPSKPTKMDRLVLKIPLQAGVAKFLHANRTDLTRYNPFYYCFRDTYSGAIPEGGWKSDFYPFVTVSNEDVGLCWFAESDKLWRPSDAASAIRIVREGGQVNLVVEMIGRPTALEGKTTFTFGLQATPIKPLPANWRNWRIFDLSYGMEEAGSKLDGQPKSEPDFPRSPTGNDLGIFWTGPDWSQHFGFPSYRSDTTKHVDIWKEALRSKIDILPYWNAAWVSSALPEWQRHEFDWTSYSFQDDQSSDVMTFKAPIRAICSQSESWNDFIAHAFDEGIKNSLVTGWYQDGFCVGSCVNLAHGCGYVDEEGRTRPTYPIFARREMFKRLRAIFKSHHPNAPFLGHVSFQIQPPITGLADAMLVGEHVAQSAYTLKGKDTPPFDGWYATRVPPDTFFAEYSGRHLGIIPFVFTGVHETDPEKSRLKTEHMMGLFLVHDAPGIWARYGDHPTVFRFFRALDKFGIGDAEFVPYWGTVPPATGVPENVKISAYKKDGKALLVIANLAAADVREKVTLSAAALGLDPAGKWTAKDALTGGPIALESGPSFELVLPPYGTLLVSFEK